MALSCRVNGHVDSTCDTDPVTTSAELTELLTGGGGTLSIPYFDGREVQVENIDDFPLAEVAPAMEAFLALSPQHRIADSHHVFAYMKDTIDLAGEDVIEDMGGTEPAIDNIWEHVTPSMLYFSAIDQGQYADRRTMYVLLEGAVTWEYEHGLLMSWADGNRLVKVGPFDDHPTNGHASADRSRDEFVFDAASDRWATRPG